jgi:hypothetical protein
MRAGLARRIHLRILRNHYQLTRALTVTRPLQMPANNNTMAEYFNSMLSWLRMPVLASSGLAVVLSSLLYFKQTSVHYGFTQISH